ncbi:MAG: hypothetical protein QOD77_1810 [Thermoplasmata archaeon]|jgi:hypothetical protein|nr:hypothetical protein [Thermoplasmata archaeon]
MTPIHPPRTLRPALRAGLAVAAVAFGVLALLALATPSDAAMIDNGVVKLGINPSAALNVPGGSPTPVSGTSIVGIRQMSNNYDGVSPGCTCEGWGIAYDGSVTGYANTAVGSYGYTVLASSGTASTYSTKVKVGDLEVTHDFTPSTATPYLYQIDVTIKNTGAPHSDLLYRRVMDWDIEASFFNEFVTLASVSPVPSWVKFSSNNGFASADPLVGPSSIGSYGPPTGNVIDAGPKDHGALFDFQLGPIGAGSTTTLRLYYGVAPTESDANTARAAVGAQVWSYGQTSTAPTLGTPNTFIFAAGPPTPPKPPVCDSTSTASAPGTLTAAGAAGPKVDLSWGAAFSACPLTYEVHRSTTSASGPFSLLATTAATAHTDTTVANCATYWYRVRALAPAGAGPWSNVAAAITPSVAPSAPTGLAGTPSGTSVNLAWTPPASPCAFQQRVEVQSGATWATVPPAPLAATVSTHVHSPVAACTTYTYRVVAFNAAGSATSAPASVTTGAVAPSAPTGLSAAPTPATPTSSIDLAWTPPPASTCPFQQRVEIPLGAGWTTLHSGLPASAASDVDAPLPPCQARSYRVVAYNSAGDSPPSNVAGTMTAAVAPAAPTLTAATHFPPATVSPLGNTGPLNHEKWMPGSGSPCPDLAYDLERTIVSTGATTILPQGLVLAADDLPVQPCETYVYRVRAVTYGGVTGPWSNALSVATWIAPPGPVTNAVAYSKSMATGRVEHGLTGIVDWDVPTANNCPVVDYKIYKTDNTFAPLGIDLYNDPHAVVPHPTTVLEDTPNVVCVRYTYDIQADNTALGGGLGPAVQVSYVHMIYVDADTYAGDAEAITGLPIAATRGTASGATGLPLSDVPMVALPVCGLPCMPLDIELWDTDEGLAYHVDLDDFPFYEKRDPAGYPAGIGYDLLLESQCVPDPPCMSQRGDYLYDNPFTGTSLWLELAGAPKVHFHQGVPDPNGAVTLPTEPVGTGKAVVVECVPALPCLWANAGYTNQVLGFGGWASAPGSLGAYVHQPTLGGPNPLGTYYAGAALGCIPDVPCLRGGGGYLGVRPLDADVYWPGADGGSLVVFAYTPDSPTATPGITSTSTLPTVDRNCVVDCRSIPSNTLVNPCDPCPDMPNPGPLPCGVCTRVQAQVVCDPVCPNQECIPDCEDLGTCPPPCDPRDPKAECCESALSADCLVPTCEDLLGRPCTCDNLLGRSCTCDSLAGRSCTVTCHDVPRPNPSVDPCNPCPPSTTGPVPCDVCPPAPPQVCSPPDCDDVTNPVAGHDPCRPPCSVPINVNTCLPCDPTPIQGCTGTLPCVNNLDDCLPVTTCDPTPIQNCIPELPCGTIQECIVRQEPICVTVGGRNPICVTNA